MLTLPLQYYGHTPPRTLPSFPTRRSSDLAAAQHDGADHRVQGAEVRDRSGAVPRGAGGHAASADRKSTRLNSSHEWSSYAVFCLKKKRQSWCQRDPGRVGGGEDV